MQPISDLLDQVAEHPLPTGDRPRAHRRAALYGIVTPLYNRNYWILLSQALRSALDGDGSLLMRLADAYASRNADGTYAKTPWRRSRRSPASTTPTRSPSQVPAEFPAFDRPRPTFGRVFAWSLVACDWPPARRPRPSR